ncbi:MAG: hypothetical protein R2838_20670 [Caldilineaceae bacterium]
MIDSLGKLAYWRIGLGMGRFERERDLRRAIALAKEIGQGTEIIRQGNLGWLLTNKGDYRLALTALDASQTEVNESADSPGSLDQCCASGDGLAGDGMPGRCRQILSRGKRQIAAMRRTSF